MDNLWGAREEANTDKRLIELIARAERTVSSSRHLFPFKEETHDKVTTGQLAPGPAWAPAKHRGKNGGIEKGPESLHGSKRKTELRLSSLQ